MQRRLNKPENITALICEPCPMRTGTARATPYQTKKGSWKYATDNGQSALVIDDGFPALTLLGLDSDTFYIYHVAAVMVDNLRRLLLGINLSDKAVMDFDFPGVGFPV